MAPLYSCNGGRRRCDRRESRLVREPAASHDAYVFPNFFNASSRRLFGQVADRWVWFFFEVELHLDLGECLLHREPERQVGEVGLGKADSMAVAGEHGTDHLRFAGHVKSGRRSWPPCL